MTHVVEYDVLQVCSLDVVHQVKQEVMIHQMCSHHPFITPLTHHWQTRKLLIVSKYHIAMGPQSRS